MKADDVFAILVYLGIAGLLFAINYAAWDAHWLVGFAVSSLTVTIVGSICLVIYQRVNK